MIYFRNLLNNKYSVTLFHQVKVAIRVYTDTYVRILWYVIAFFNFLIVLYICLFLLDLKLIYIEKENKYILY